MSEEFANDVSHDAGAMAESVLSEPSQPVEYDAPPQSWKPDVANRHWSKLDPELRGYVHAREKEANGKITQQGQRLRELEATAQRVADLDGFASRYRPLDTIFEQNRADIPEGMEPAQAFEQMLHAHRQLIADPLALAPQVREQLARFETTRRELQSLKEAEVQRTLDEFTKGKDYYPEIRQDVIKEIVEIRKGAPGLDNATVLRLAHDRVVERTGIKSRLDMEAQARALEEQQKQNAEREKAQREENDRRVKAARRAGGINVRSSPASRPASRTMEDDLKAIWRKNHG